MKTNIPTAEEFNRKMHECVECQKLVKLQDKSSTSEGAIIKFSLGGMFCPPPHVK